MSHISRYDIAWLPVTVVTACCIIMAIVRVVNGERTAEAIFRRSRTFNVLASLCGIFCIAVLSWATTRPYMRLLLTGGAILASIVGVREFFKRPKPPDAP